MKHYDAAIMLEINNTCNFNCHYCISEDIKKGSCTLNLKKIEEFLKKAKKTFVFVYEGDREPFLHPQIIELGKLITRYGHYLAPTSNLTPLLVKEFIKEINPEQVDYFIASAHIKELEKRKLFKTYFDNHRALREKGINVFSPEVAHPSLAKEVEKYKKLFARNGVKLYFDPFKGKYKGKTYPDAYTKKELAAFSLTKKDVEKLNMKGRYCNAGYNIFAAELVSNNGDIYNCRELRNKVGNLNEGTLKLAKEPFVCSKEYCQNPYIYCNQQLHEKMLRHTKGQDKPEKPKKHKYEAVLLWSPNNSCNFRCEYCISDGYSQKTGKINIRGLRDYLKKTKRKTVFLFNGGGEPFLTPNIIEACETIIKKGHYLAFNTNLTIPRVLEIAKRFPPEKVIHIIASTHIKELEKNKLLDKFIKHFKVFQEKGFNILAKEVAYPGLLKEVSHYRKVFAKQGIQLEFEPFIGNYKGKEYPHQYSDYDLRIFGITKEQIKAYYRKGKKCNIGFNVAYVNDKGEAFDCYPLQTKRGNINTGITFDNHLIRCPADFCSCPVSEFFPEAYSYALEHEKPEKKIGRQKKPKKKRTLKKVVFYAKMDRKLGKIGKHIKKISPGTYKVAKRIEKTIRGTHR